MEKSSTPKFYTVVEIEKIYTNIYVSLRSNIAAVIFEFLTSKGYIFDSFTTKYKEIWVSLAPKEE